MTVSLASGFDHSRQRVELTPGLNATKHLRCTGQALQLDDIVDRRQVPGADATVRVVSQRTHLGIRTLPPPKRGLPPPAPEGMMKPNVLSDSAQHDWEYCAARGGHNSGAGTIARQSRQKPDDALVPCTRWSRTESCFSEAEAAGPGSGKSIGFERQYLHLKCGNCRRHLRTAFVQVRSIGTCRKLAAVDACQAVLTGLQGPAQRANLLHLRATRRCVVKERVQKETAFLLSRLHTLGLARISVVVMHAAARLFQRAALWTSSPPPSSSGE